MQSETRQRERPQTRFAKAQDVLDLNDEFRELMAEPESGQHGHRQKALIREGPLTAAIYALDAGSRWPDHVVDGVVLIHLLEGHVQVATGEGSLELKPGQMVRLASGVRHDLSAIDASRVLLTIALEGPDSHS